MTNLEIAQATKLRPIQEVAQPMGLEPADYDTFGKAIAKLTQSKTDALLAAPRRGKLILVTAINPTPAGEGKTTVTVGLTQGLAKIDRKAIAAIREPALGPIFGIKGGACGGGYSQVLPMEEINLFFTGDLPAITAAHNLLSAAVDAHIHHGHTPKIDASSVWWPRAVDMIDRSLRETVVGLGNGNGPVRSESFVITAASEVMATLCLADSLADLRYRLDQIVVGLTADGAPVTVKHIGVGGAMAALLTQAIRPNLVQTIEGCPAFVHGGPFGNIAHGCSSLIATRCGLALADFVVTEAGFGSDLGAEKFFDIVCPKLGYGPDAVVLVATVRALKYDGKGDLIEGCKNLARHLAHIDHRCVPAVVAVNRFADDTEEDLETVLRIVRDLGARAVIANPWGGGGDGCVELAKLVSEAAFEPASFAPAYLPIDPFEAKLQALVDQVYGGEHVILSGKAKKQLSWLESHGFANLPVCVAKTQYSLSDEPKLIGAPTGFDLHVREIKLSAGAGFLVAICGEIMLMPGMGAKPSALNIDVEADGRIVGLN